MNIKITHNWLLEYLDTDADAEEIQKYLSLSGPSIEKVEKRGVDYVYGIEIISNRIDTASVLGIAQEAAAILPMFGKKAELKLDPLKKYKFSQVLDKLEQYSSSERSESRSKLKIKIAGTNLCSRFTAVVLDNIGIKPSPGFISERLVACGIKSINSVVDISNFLMLAFGQPVHVFDYDQIGGASMIMRESKNGEKIITLDEKEVNLLGGDIVIEDGEGKLIDLCGIMGGFNSSVTNKTKRVVLFVQTYNKEKIRKTAMTTGVRTVAATYFEKGLDEERVEATTVYGIDLLKKHADGVISSPLYDIYPNRYQAKQISITISKFEKSIGIKIDKKIIVRILKSLNFKTEEKGESLKVTVPSFRKYDVTYAQDLIEEVARIYGYQKLPSSLPPPAKVEQPEESQKLFSVIDKIKYFLKHLGLTESINYSMMSQDLIKEIGLGVENHLRVANTISRDIEYMRTSLIPSLYKNLKDNTGKSEVLRFFEIGKIYLPKKNNLPQETYKLGIAVNTDYFDLKGIVEALRRELNIETRFAGEIVRKDSYFLVELDVQRLIDNYRIMPVYRPINPYAVVKLDKTFELGPKLNYENIKITAAQSSLLQKIEVITLYQNKLTLRFYYSSSSRNITEEEAKKELAKI